MSDDKVRLLDIKEEMWEDTERRNTHQSVQSTQQHEIDPVSAKPRNPIMIKNIVLEEDFYALTWTALRESVWKEKKIRGQSVFLTAPDFFWIHMFFTLFVFVLVLTVVLILNEVITDKEYTASNFTIVILRVTLVCFAQKSLSPEFYQGLFLLRYSTRYPHLFTHYEFSVFIGTCQLSVATICFSTIILFVCIADEALDLVIEFAGLTVIANLDNWLGELIMFSRIKNTDECEDDDHEYDLRDLNKRLTTSQKLALINEEDLVLVDDQNEIDHAPFIITLLERIVNLLPWQYILPFITIVFNYLLPLLKPKLE